MLEIQGEQSSGKTAALVPYPQASEPTSTAVGAQLLQSIQFVAGIQHSSSFRPQPTSRFRFMVDDSKKNYGIPRAAISRYGMLGLERTPRRLHLVTSDLRALQCL